MSPEGGSVVPAGSEVIIYVNMLQGGTSAVVPDMVGVRLADALKMLNENNLKKGIITEVADDAPAGTVIEQSMPAGTKVAGNTAIDLTVSKGPAVQTYSNVHFQVPSGPTDGSGGPYEYQVKITVDGNTHQTVNVTNTMTVTINTFTVSKNNTKIRVYLVYGSVENLYLVFNASNTESDCRKESGTEASTWPFRAMVTSWYMPDLTWRRRFGLY